MTDADPAHGRSRRAVLSACGAGVAALAGCADLDVTGVGGGDDGPEYDPGRIDAIARQDVPPRRDEFPVTVPDAAVDRHYERGRDLLSTVPERPAVPNGVVARRLRRERQHVAEDLRTRTDAETGLRRLSGARRDRADAAELDGAYRAAVGEIDPEPVAERRAGIRAGVRRFESEWTYRGADPASALVVHAELEDLVDRARQGAEAWPAFPADPATDVFAVGELVRNVELGEASLADAGGLRSWYLDGTENENGSRPHRATITAAAHRLHRRISWERRRLHEFEEVRAADLPFDRSVDGTPAEHLYRRAQSLADRDGLGGREALDDGEHATATLRGARSLAAVRAFDATLDAIEAGEYGPPADAEQVATVREAAVAALEDAWAVTPTVVSAELAWPARDALLDGHRDLERASGDGHEVNDAVGMFAYARLYAEAVPAVVADVVEALEATA